MKRLRISLRVMFVLVTLVAIAVFLFLRPAFQRRDLERQIASYGGEVATRQPDGVYWRIVRELLGRTYAGEIVGVVFCGTTATDRELSILGKCTNLESVTVRSTDNGDEFVSHICNLPNLSYVDLSGTFVTDRSLDLLAGKELSHLDLCNTKVRKQAVQEFSQDHETMLVLWCPQISDDDRRTLQRAASSAYVQYQPTFYSHGYSSAEIDGVDGSHNDPILLEAVRVVVWQEGGIDDLKKCGVGALSRKIALQIDGLTLTREECQFLGSLPIASLKLVQVQSVACEWICDLQGLVSLKLVDFSPRDGWGFLSQIEGLRYLVLESNSISEQELLSVSPGRLPLEELMLASMPISDKVLQHIAKFTRLKQLSFVNSPIDDTNGRCLANLKSLEGVWFRGSAVDEETVKALRSLPNLTAVDID